MRGHPGRTPQGPTALEAPDEGARPLVYVEEVLARLSDEPALARLLASIPTIPQSVRPLLSKPFFGRKWDCAKQLDHWLASDGATVVCLKISGASASVAMRMRLRFDDLRGATPGLQPSRRTVHRLLEAIAREDGRLPTVPLNARSRALVKVVQS